MTIQHILVFTCECCNRSEVMAEEVSLYDTPVIRSPSGKSWDYVDVDEQEKFACPECFDKYDRGPCSAI